MSKIPYGFRTPIPSFFDSYLDPTKESYTNRMKFLRWSFSRCYCVPWNRDGIQYDAYKFSFSRQSAAEECGMTEKSFRIQLEYHIENGYLKLTPNEIKNRYNTFQWQVEKFCKVVLIEESKQEATNQQAPDSLPQISCEEEGPTDLRDKAQEKGPTDSEKGQPKGQPRGQPIYETKQVEKGQPRGQPRGPFYKNDKEAIESSLDDSDNISKSREAQKSSLSCRGKIIAFFNPRTYRLRNGQHLSMRMQNALMKYSPNEQERLLANAIYYEQWVDSGKPIKSSHEAFFQFCIRDDMAMKSSNKIKNDLYAKFIKMEYDACGIEILDTVVKIRKSYNEEPDQISKELNSFTFETILDNYIRNYYSSGIAYAK